jgi:hypothetical protein
MKGGAAYQDWGGDGQGLYGEMRCFGAGDMAVQLSVGSMRMQFWSDQDFKWKGNLWE